MPTSQKMSALSGSNRICCGRFLIWQFGPPSFVQSVPPLVVAHNPAPATPAMTLSEFGTGKTRHRLPHSLAILARFPVAGTQSAAWAERVEIATRLARARPCEQAIG